jgi:Ca-activated chloride channel homolog
MNVQAGSVQVTATPHRSALLQDRADQKLFVAIRCTAPYAVIQEQVTTTVVVVDISGSMNGNGGGGKSKMQLVREALHAVADGPSLTPEDRLGIVTFDIDGKVVREVHPIGDRAQLHSDIERVDLGEGTTYLLDALITARRMLANSTGTRQLVLLTDGEVFDANDCLEQVTWFSQQAIPITAVGVGSEWNQSFLTEVADRTHGQLHHMIADDDLPAPTSIRLSDLAGALSKEWNRSRRRTSTDVRLELKIPMGANIISVHKVFPNVSELPRETTISCGNLASGESMVALVDMTCPARSSGEYRMLQVIASAGLPDGSRQPFDPVDVVVNSTDDTNIVFAIDPEVQNWMQQRNIAGLLTRASDATVSVEDRRSALVQAQGMANRVANVDLGKTIRVALGDLDRSKTVRVDVAKALHVAGKTHTLDFSRGALLTPEIEAAIQQLTDPKAGQL